MIPKRNLGGRHLCSVCGTRYYDLNREEIKCPKCGQSVSDDGKVDPRLAAMARLKAEGQARKAGAAGIDGDDDAEIVDDDEIVDFSDEDDDMETPEGEEDEEPISEDFDDV
jgi:hypothetical protein